MFGSCCRYKRECKVCSKKFFHKVHYLEHLRVHSGEKPFACTVCGKRYPYVNSVKRHMQSHNVLAKYKCRLCGKCFR
ncbi:UNVERIFIED_CONTAM: hypothetical protein GTU68_028043 [Idotea baltica]|nr:hypothetical protein [Idotea baltica]